MSHVTRSFPCFHPPRRLQLERKEEFNRALGGVSSGHHIWPTCPGRPGLLPPASRVTRPDSPPVRLRDPAATPVWRGVASHPSHAPCSEQKRATPFRHGQDAHHDSAYSLRPARHAALLIHICPKDLPSVIVHVHHSVPEAVVPWSQSSGHRGQRQGDLPSVCGEPVRRSR